jgi:C1A family cysteine protease
MKALAILLAVLTAAGMFLSQNKFDFKELQQVNPIAARFNQWKQAMNKHYGSPELEAYRMSVFAENLAYIEAENSRQSEYQLGETFFTDLTTEEFTSQYLGYAGQSSNRVSDLDFEADYQVPNAAFTWQGKGVITPVKNQGSCGSCWAFSTTGTVEGYWAINKGSLPSLSEQQLVDCVGIAYGCLGCNGGQMSGALKWIKSNGVTTEDAYPYTGRDGRCSTKTGAYKVSSVKSTSGCNSLTADIQTQPTSVAVDATNWSLYRSGVFSNCAKNLNHGVLAVGYDVSGNWIIKNSWGTSWGQQGYMNLKSGDTCGVCQEMNNAY